MGSRLETGAAAPLTLHFFVTFFEKAFTLAIRALYFALACDLLHVLTKSKPDGYSLAGENATQPLFTIAWPTRRREPCLPSR
jgi:hypothetical protein